MSNQYPNTQAERKTKRQMLAELDKSQWFSGIENYDPSASLSHLKSVMGMNSPDFKNTLYGNGTYTVPSELLTMYSFHTAFKAIHEKRANTLRLIRDGEYTESSPGRYEDDPIEDTYEFTPNQLVGLHARVAQTEQEWENFTEIAQEVFKPGSELGSALTFGVGEVMRQSLAQEHPAIRVT